MNREIRRPKRRLKRCTLYMYHFGSVLLFCAIIVLFTAMCTAKLFVVSVFDNRKPARFLTVHIPVGLYSSKAIVTWLSLEKDYLEYPLELNDVKFIVATSVTTVGILVTIATLILHVFIMMCKARHRWSIVVFEVFGLLIAVICVLVGLSFAESEIEHIHDNGDAALAKLLVSNGLFSENDEAMSVNGKPVAINKPPQTNAEMLLDGIDIDPGADFALLLSPPQSSFVLLVIADFTLLFAFLCVLIYFVRVCERAQKDRKQQRKAEFTTNQ